MIKITNEYIDKMGTGVVVKSLLKKEFSCKTSYWLARIFNELEGLSKTFMQEKQKIVNRYAKKDSNDNVISDGTNVTILDITAFQKDIAELLEIELDLQKEQIIFDIEKEPKCTIEEMLLLLPLIEVEK